MSTFDPLLYDNYEASTDLSPDEINSMEDRRLNDLSEAGINEQDELPFEGYVEQRRKSRVSTHF
jgi:hypothetical protein